MYEKERQKHESTFYWKSRNRVFFAEERSGASLKEAVANLCLHCTRLKT